MSQLSALALDVGGEPLVSSNLLIAAIACGILATLEIPALRHATPSIAFGGGIAFAIALTVRVASGLYEDSIVVPAEATAFLVVFAAVLPIGWARQLALGGVTVAGTALALFLSGANGPNAARAVASVAVAAASAAVIAWCQESRESRLRARLARMRQRARHGHRAGTPADDHRIADLSHDLRNPLAVAIGYSEMAADADLPDEERARALARVKRSLWELTQMVENVLESSADEAGALVVRAGPVEVGALCQELAASARILARGRPLRIQSRSEPDLLVLADRQRLVRVLSNLLGNAIKYTERGDIMLEARAEGDRVTFEVRDTGPGISAEKLPRIFGRYQRSSETAGGVGLGLAIARLLTERMGGAIAVESALGEGSRFRVTLPRVDRSRVRLLAPKAA